MRVNTDWHHLTAKMWVDTDWCHLTDWPHLTARMEWILTGPTSLL